jgi:kumamolisin
VQQLTRLRRPLGAGGTVRLEHVVRDRGATSSLWWATKNEWLGLLQPALYAGVEPGTPVEGLRDITTGNNGAYKAGPGSDACSGLGVPVGVELLTRLSGGSGGSG